MSRDTSIKIIEGTYAPDSRIPEVAAVGRDLLIEAICINWREVLSDKVLLTLSRLCEVTERTKGRSTF